MGQLTNVVTDRTEVHINSDVCHICECEFSLDEEGGVCGHIGILLVVFCATCHAGLHDMYTNWYCKDEDDNIVPRPGKQI